MPLPQWVKKPLGIQTGHCVPQVELELLGYCHTRDRNKEVTFWVEGNCMALASAGRNFTHSSQLVKVSIVCL